MRMQGCDRAALSERGADLYETAPQAVHALLGVECLPNVIWEPCAGRGAIVRELRSAGFSVIAADLHRYPGADPTIDAPRDFFEEESAPRGCDCIVTNPPFQCADEFVRAGLRLVSRVIVFLRFASLEGTGRSDLIDVHLRQVWLGRERLPMMHRDGWNGRRLKDGGAPFAWFVFERERRSRTISLQRISWRTMREATE